MYGILMYKVPKNNANSFTIISVVLAITEKEKFKIYDIIESFSEFEKENEDDTEIIHENGRTKYINKKLGYAGIADAKHIGNNLSSEEIKKYFSDLYNSSTKAGYDTKQLQKLTKEQDWLLQQAMQKYERKWNTSSKKKEETYVILLSPTPKSFPAKFTGITVVLTITDINNNTGGYSYTFYAIEQTATK